MPEKIRAHVGKLLLTLLLLFVSVPQVATGAAAAPAPPREALRGFDRLKLGAIECDQDSATKQIDLRNLPTAQTEGAGTGTSAVLSTALTTGPTGGRGIAYRVTVCVTGANSTFGIDFDDDGTLPPQLFDRGAALVADCLYTFTFEATEDDEVNFTFGSTTTIVRLVVSEIRGGEL